MVDIIGPSELAALQRDCGIPNTPTQLTYHLRLAPSFANADAPFGSYAYQWRDKPHRLLYMACSEAEALQAENERLRAIIDDPPKHRFWGAGEPDCPREIKAGNGELHTLRCKVCGQDSPRDEICRAALEPKP